MALKPEFIPCPVRVPGGGWVFQWRSILVPACDFCERTITRPEVNICRRCREEFELIAARLAAYGIGPVTPKQVRMLGFGLRPRRFVYGKPWHHHLPPHERERYGLHT